MSFNIQNRKFVAIIPLFILMITLSGVVGIVATALNDPSLSYSYNETTSTLTPGEFEVVPIFIQDTNSLTDLTISIGGSVVDESYIDILFLDTNPGFNQGANITKAIEDLNFASIIKQDISASSSSTVFVENVDVVYLIVANNYENPDDQQIFLTISVDINDNGSNASYVLSIVGTALFTFLMLLLTVFAFIEFFEPDKYKAKFLTVELDKQIEMIVTNAESWEITVLVISFISFPIGVTMSFAGVSAPLLFFSIAGIVGVYYLVTKRLNLLNSIRNILFKQREISLNQLATAVGRDEDAVRKAVYYLISHEQFPIQYNATTEVVIYTGTSAPRQTQTRSSTPMQVQDPVDIVQEEVQEPTPDDAALPQCAYCGAEAIIRSAKFCAECGASMVASK